MNSKKVIIICAVITIIVAIVIEMYVNNPLKDFQYLESAKFNEETTDLSGVKIYDDPNFPLVEFDYGTTTYWDKQIIVNESLTTELPLVVIDVGYDTIEKNMYWDSELGYMRPIEGVDPYSYGVVSIIDNDDTINVLSDDPSMTSNSLVSIRGNTSQGYDKKQYKIVLTDEKYENKDMNVLDVGTGHEWVLNGTFTDGTIMRNYLAYTLAGQFMNYSPDSAYVELVIKNGDTYEYQGIFLLTESVERGSDRVDIPKYSSNSINHATFIMKRDRFSDDGVFLDNYSFENELAYGFIEVLYPNDLSSSTVDLLTSKVDSFEKALYSDDPTEFEKYKNYIDIESFYDYFIINELFLNYDAGFNSTYFYSDYSGKIIMGPVWDFDLAFNNDRFVEANFETTAFHNAPWYDRLLKDAWFVESLINRYHELRTYYLSNDHFFQLVDSVDNHLGSAIDREWSRWGYYYEANLYNLFESGDTDYESEVQKIKDSFLKHSEWLDENIDSLYQFTDQNLDTNSDININWGNVLGFTFVAIWIVAVIILQRRMS